MQKLTIAALAALLATPSLAQDVHAPAANNMQTPAEASSAEMPRDHNGNPLELPTLMAIYDTAQFASGDAIAAATDPDKIYVVKLSQLENGEDQATPPADTSGIDALRASLSSNSMVAGKVTDAGFSADDIVAVRTSADGGLIVFIDDRAM